MLEEHEKSDERSLEENVWTWDVCKSKKRCLLIAHCFRPFVLWVPLFGEKSWRYIARKVMEFSLQMADIPVYVSCKFETDNLKLLLLVISDNVRFAFLYVLSI